MKIRHYVFLLTLFVVSCKKETDVSGVCWTCTVERMNGTTFRDTKCGGTETAPPNWYDNNNNQLNAYDCERK